jgi:hypothetical protein
MRFESVFVTVHVAGKESGLRPFFVWQTAFWLT